MADLFRPAVDASATAAEAATDAAADDDAGATAGHARPDRSAGADCAAGTGPSRAHAERGAEPDLDARSRTEGDAAHCDRNAARWRLDQSQGRPHRRPHPHAVPRDGRSEIAAGGATGAVRLADAVLCGV